MTNEVSEVKAFFVPVVEVETGELALEFPDELMESLNVKSGENLLWIETESGWKVYKQQQTQD